MRTKMTPCQTRRLSSDGITKTPAGAFFCRWLYSMPMARSFFASGDADPRLIVELDQSQ